jgi:RNA polymerase sigma-70 factor (ECF subfamily)
MPRRISEETAEQVAQLFVAVAPDLFQFAVTLVQGDRASAEDLVQEAFQAVALAWVKVGSYDLDCQRAWLFTVTRNKAINRWKANRRVTSELDMVRAVEITDRDDTHDKVLNSLTLDRCREVLRSMPPARYRIAYLHFYEEWRPSEIAKHLGLSASTVRVQIKRARDQLANAIGPDIPLAGEPEPGKRRKEA